MSESVPSEFESQHRVNKIERFAEQYRFLSSMWELKVGIDTEFGPVPTVEHAYQMAKFVDSEARLSVAETLSGYRAKKIAKRLKNRLPVEALNPDWDETKITIMSNLTREKFLKNPDLAKQLVDTGDAYIEEGNTWDDRFWGVSPPGSGNGENWLGIILMEVRSDLLEDQQLVGLS